MPGERSPKVTRADLEMVIGFHRDLLAAAIADAEAYDRFEGDTYRYARLKASVEAFLAGTSVLGLSVDEKLAKLDEAAHG